MTAYYNEFDLYAAEWLRNLIKAGHIAPGDVDSRSITDVSADDLKPYTQCHFFAGIGVWSHALRSSAWEDSRPVWTGSCPCQPFSVAGKGEGQADERHLWPVWFKLIEQCRPPVVFGEQVASVGGLEWLDGVLAGMESADYSCWATDICAAGVGAPHIRQRLYWVGYSKRKGLERYDWHGAEGGSEKAAGSNTSTSCRSAGPSGMDALHVLRGVSMHDSRDTRNGLRLPPDRGVGDYSIRFWEQFDALPCSDGWRRVRPGTFPLVNGATSRVGRLRAYGNAIVPQVAQEVIEAFMAYRP